MTDLLLKAARIAPARLKRAARQSEFLRRLYDRSVVTQNFSRAFGRPLDLSNPTTFNEKVAYKMLNDRRPLLVRLADKLQARDYVAERVGSEYLTELYQTCRFANEIDWQALPRRFVIKTNHGCCMNIFVPDKSEINTSAISSRLDEWLSLNFYYKSREWCYRDIRPSILIEELLTDRDGTMAIDWKFFTFDGRAEYLQVDVDRFTHQKRNIYDRKLVRLPLRGRHPNAPIDPEFPANIDRMFLLADRLGDGLDFVRVDLYNIGGRIVFGEFTNYPGAGEEPFDPPAFDEIFGSKWQLSPCYRGGTR